MVAIIATEGLKIGAGFDIRFCDARKTFLDAAKQSVEIEGNSEAVALQFTARSVSSNDKRQLITALNDGNCWSLPWLLNMAPPILRWALETRFDPTCVYILLRAQVRYPMREFRQAKIDDDDKQNIDDISSADFLKIYGSHYIAGSADGGVLDAIIKIQTESFDEKNQLEEMFNTDISVASIDEAFDERLQQLITQHKTSATLFKTGRLQNFITQIDELISAIRLYADEVVQHKVTTSFLLKDYASLGITALDEKSLAKLAIQKQLLEDLGQQYVDTQTNIAAVEFVLAHIWDNFNGHGIIFAEYETLNEAELQAKESLWQEHLTALHNNIKLLQEHSQSLSITRDPLPLTKELFIMSETLPTIKTENHQLKNLEKQLREQARIINSLTSNWKNKRALRQQAQ